MRDCSQEARVVWFRCEGMEGKTRQGNNSLQPWRSWWRMMGATRAWSVAVPTEGRYPVLGACLQPTSA